MAEYARVGRSSLYDDVANELEAMIHEEALKVGNKLPSEQELAEKFGVSRNICERPSRPSKSVA